MSANKDDFVLLHPPQEQGFAGHPQIWGNCSYLCCFRWSREPFCLSWYISRENPAENVVSEGKKKESPFRLVMCKRDFSYTCVHIPDRELSSTHRWSSNHTLIESQNFKTIQGIKFTELLWETAMNCPNTPTPTLQWTPEINTATTEILSIHKRI